MKFCLVQGLEENCLFIRSAGAYDATHVRAMIKAASALDFYKRRVTIMYDMRLVHFTLNPDAIRWLVSTLPDEPTHSDTALVADTDVGFEMISLYADLRGIIPQSMGAFRTMDQALSWLKVPGAEQAIPDEIAAILDAAFTEADRWTSTFHLTVSKVTTGAGCPAPAQEVSG